MGDQPPDDKSLLRLQVREQKVRGAQPPVIEPSSIHIQTELLDCPLGHARAAQVPETIRHSTKLKVYIYELPPWLNMVRLHRSALVRFHPHSQPRFLAPLCTARPQSDKS